MQTQTPTPSSNSDAPAPAFRTRQPTALDYKALLDRTSAALQEYGAGQIDARTFRRRLDEIHAQTRILDLLCRLHRTGKDLAQQQQNASPVPASS